MSRWSLSAPATLALCALLNVSCVTVGQPFDTARLRDVYKGQPRTEVVDWFGEPAHGNKLSLVDSPNGCVKRYRYAFADREHSFVLWVDFDDRNRVCNTVVAEG
jgi:hypothetical protein